METCSKEKESGASFSFATYYELWLTMQLLYMNRECLCDHSRTCHMYLQYQDIFHLTIFIISNSEEVADDIATVLSHNIKLQELATSR